jgi:hypothetical protein
MASNKRDINERLWFVRYWANYIKATPNAEWSRQQALLINSVLKSSNKDPTLYMRIKEKAMGLKS